MSSKLPQLPTPDWLEPTRRAMKEGIDQAIAAAQENAKELFTYFGEQIRDGVSKLMQDMIDLILTTPLVADNPIIVKIWSFVRVVSFCLIGMMFVWQGFKKVTSHGSIGSEVNFKDMFVRMVYGLMLAVFSLDIVDIIIQLNNALVSTMKDNFKMFIDSNLDTTGVWSFIVTLGLVIVQTVLGLKLAVRYFMRMGEIWLMAVLGPIVYTLWINPSWSGYLGGWLRRMFTTIFTTFIWSLILVLYTAMVGTVAMTGTIWGMCMSIALLLIMLETPDFLRQFMDSQQNPLQLLNNAKNKTLNTIRNTRNIGSNIAGKVSGWIIKK